jgi:hypothetical protein
MENGILEQWKSFLNKNIKVIIEDTDFPKKKQGVCKNVSETHLFLDSGFKTEALLLTKILRVEVQQ